LTLQIKWHKSVSETVLIDRFSSKTALLRESTKNGSCKKTLYSDKENKWTQSIAVGSKAFIEKMKEALGFRATGRKIIYADDTFELREVLTPYGKANNLDSENTFLWDQQSPSLIGQFLHEN
jgi:hypothetical protein